MKVRVRQCPKEACSTGRWPRGAHPVVLLMLVFTEVSSMTVSLSRWLAMKGWRLAIRIRRLSATSLRFCSGACRCFFVTETKPAQQPSDRGAMHVQPVFRAQFRRQFVNRQLRLSTQSFTPVSLPRPGVPCCFGSSAPISRLSRTMSLTNLIETRSCVTLCKIIQFSLTKRHVHLPFTSSAACCAAARQT